jgi:hypothetical protein
MSPPACRGCRRQPPTEALPTRRHSPSTTLASIHMEHLSLPEPNQSAKAANPSAAGIRAMRLRWRIVATAGGGLRPLLWVEILVKIPR